MERNRLLYFYDALCGWCYGFSPVMQALQESFASQLKVEVISGGMITGEREGYMDPSMSSYILNTIPRLQSMTGVQFGEAYQQQLKEGSRWQSSVKPSIALTVFRALMPDQQLAFAAAIQRAQFLDGKDLQDDATYTELLQPFSIAPDSFLQHMQQDEYRYATQQEFQFTKEAGISGFPALVLEHRQQYYLVAKGYQPLQDLVPVIEKVLAL